MTWDRFLAGDIHIDHIIPQHTFIFESVHDEQFKACWALSNLQPLWAEDNLRKGGSIPSEISKLPYRGKSFSG